MLAREGGVRNIGVGDLRWLRNKSFTARTFLDNLNCYGYDFGIFLAKAFSLIHPHKMLASIPNIQCMTGFLPIFVLTYP